MQFLIEFRMVTVLMYLRFNLKNKQTNQSDRLFGQQTVHTFPILAVNLEMPCLRQIYNIQYNYQLNHGHHHHHHHHHHHPTSSIPSFCTRNKVHQEHFTQQKGTTTIFTHHPALCIALTEYLMLINSPCTITQKYHPVTKN